MLKDRILSTLTFFDLQDWPLTLFELHQYLLADKSLLMAVLGDNWEISENIKLQRSPAVEMGEVLSCLESGCAGEVENFDGFYCLSGRERIVRQRVSNHLFGIKREKLISRFIPGLRHIPFLRGAGLTGSQALGQQQQTSDIDLLIITDERFMWLCRTLVTAYFQVLGLRRHGKKIANRFCLNHYLAGTKELKDFRNAYTAMEYIKLRPLVYKHTISEFQTKNAGWMRQVFPNWEPFLESPEEQSLGQKILEKILNNNFGLFLERWLKRMQMPRIKKQEFILVREDELSFHPNSRQQYLLGSFFRSSVENK